MHATRKNLSWVCRCTSIIPAFGSLRQDDLEFKCIMGYITRPRLKKKKKKKE
jgi:hypothetical protein